MSCLTSNGATWGSRTINSANAVSPVMVWTEDYWDSFPALLMDFAGFDCTQARDYMLQFYAAIISNSPGIQVIKNGGVVPAITAGMMEPIDGGGAGVIANNQDIQGSWVYTTGEGGGFTNPVGAQVAGVNFSESWQIIQNVGTVAFHIPMDNILTSFNFDDWFCCATAGRGCCGGPPVGRKSGFLIPRPETPEIGDENISTPVFELPLYLSNYTAQFTNNFGRVKKI